jgi:hypothetical protein
MTDRIDDFQNHQLIGKQVQRPAPVACGRLPQSQGDQFRFCLAIELGRRGRFGSLLALQCQLKTFCHQPFAEILDRLHTAVESLGNPAVSPSRPISIRFQQYLSPTNFLRRSLEMLDDFLTNATFFFRETHDELLVHGKPPCSRKFPTVL